MKIVKKTLLNKTVSFHCKNENILLLTHQKNKSSYINKALAAYSNLEKQLPKVIIDFLINNPDEITLTYLFNKSSAFNNDNNLADVAVSGTNYPSQSSIEIDDSSLDLENEPISNNEIIDNLKNYL